MNVWTESDQTSRAKLFEKDWYWECEEPRNAFNFEVSKTILITDYNWVNNHGL